MPRWEPLPVYARDELTLEKFHELARGLQPFALTGMAWAGMGRWRDVAALVDAEGLGEDGADVMMYADAAGAPGDVQLCFESEAPLRMALGMLEAPLMEGVQGMYVKYPLPQDCKALASLPFRNFRVEKELVPAEQPMLLKPGRYFTWMYAGTAGSGSPTHIDVMNSSAWLTCVTGAKQWLLVHGADHGKFAAAPDLFSHYPSPAGGVDASVRLYHHRQEAGTAIFVPSKCWHAVKNIEDSVSLTHNFVDSTNQEYWEAAIKDFLNVE